MRPETTGLSGANPQVGIWRGRYPCCQSRGAKGKPPERAGRKATEPLFAGLGWTGEEMPAELPPRGCDSDPRITEETEGLAQRPNRSKEDHMLQRLRQRAKDEEGFTLIEL